MRAAAAAAALLLGLAAAAAAVPRADALATQAQMQLGTRPGASDVAANGTVDAAHFGNFSSVALVEVDAGQYVFRLYAQLSAGPVDEQPFTATPAVEGPANLTVSLNGGARVKGNAAVGNATEVEVALACLAEDTTFNVSLTFDLEGFDPLVVRFRKACGSAAADDAVFVDVGTEPDGKATLVANGTQTGAHDANIAVASETFYVWANGREGEDRPAYTVTGVQDRAGVAHVTARCDPCVAHLFDPLAPYNSSSLLHVAYDCVPSEKNATADIRLELQFGVAEPLVVTWTKECLGTGTGGTGNNGTGTGHSNNGTGTGHPPPHRHSAGWSAAGIFFFVVFVLSVVAFTGAAAFKYLKMGRRGVEVVPCIDACRSLCCRGGGSGGSTYASPQDERLDEPFGHATYGSVLGSHAAEGYQTNL